MSNRNVDDFSRSSWISFQNDGGFITLGDFQLLPPEQQGSVVPIEPLYTMLHDAPLKAVEYLHGELSRFEHEKELDDIVQNLGITRKRALEQTMLVLSQRKHSNTVDH